MADRYLLESGTPDGYLLEDGTGVLLIETAPLGGAVDIGADRTVYSGVLDNVLTGIG